MNSLIASDSRNLIVGAGATGLSVARHFEALGCRYDVYDTRTNASLSEPFYLINKHVRVQLGNYAPDLLQGVNRIVLSPGVARSEPIVVDALAQGIPVVSDISLFLEAANAPVVGITGTNGKSTVTTMVGLVAESAGLKVAVGGNLGVPALDLLQDTVDLYVLELSSFQLESTDNAHLTVAAHLNVSQDHLDRHGSVQHYFKAKQKIFFGAENVVYNLNDPLTQPPIVEGVTRYGFGLRAPLEKNEIQYTLNTQSDALMREGRPLIKREHVRLKGLHNIENVLALLAISDALNVELRFVEAVISDYAGLPHRCEVILSHNGFTYINDSKATNVGATVSALRGYASEFDHIVLIAGGVGKGQNFTDLGKALLACQASVILFGQDAEKIKNAMPMDVAAFTVASLDEAIHNAQTLIENVVANDKSANNLVLFSPACASFDMFANFEARGDAFRHAVQERAA